MEGERAAELAPELEHLDGVSTVTRLGDTLRVSGPDAAALDAAIKPLAERAGVAVRDTAPSLEEVFISHSRAAADNMA